MSWAYSTEGADDGWLFGIYTSPDMATWSKVPGGAIKNETESGIWAQDWFWAPECYYNVRGILEVQAYGRLTRRVGEDGVVLLVSLTHFDTVCKWPFSREIIVMEGRS